MEEIHSIRERLRNGELKNLRGQLCEFLLNHRDDFRKFREREALAWGKDIEPFTSLKLFILEKKTINFKSEMLSQVDELKQALAEASRLDHALDATRFKQDWMRAHAASWRARRILEIIFVLDQDRKYFLDLVSG